MLYSPFDNNIGIISNLGTELAKEESLGSCVSKQNLYQDSALLVEKLIVDLQTAVLETYPHINQEQILKLLALPGVKKHLRMIVWLHTQLPTRLLDEELLIKEQISRRLDSLYGIWIDYFNNFLNKRRLTGYTSFFIVTLSLICFYLRPKDLKSATKQQKLLLSLLNMTALFTFVRNLQIDTEIRDNRPGNLLEPLDALMDTLERLILELQSSWEQNEC